jgi:hypothetical protein
LGNSVSESECTTLPVFALKEEGQREKRNEGKKKGNQ